MTAKKTIKKNMFAIGVATDGELRAIGRVETFDQILAAVERNTQARLTTQVRMLNFSQLNRVVCKIMEG